MTHTGHKIAAVQKAPHEFLYTLRMRLGSDLRKQRLKIHSVTFVAFAGDDDPYSRGNGRRVATHLPLPG
jgi:hypothetical protein